MVYHTQNIYVNVSAVDLTWKNTWNADKKLRIKIYSTPCILININISTNHVIIPRNAINKKPWMFNTDSTVNVATVWCDLVKQIINFTLLIALKVSRAFFI